MLSKLAFRNVKRSVRDYIIYIVTVTLAFSFIFAFNIISNSKDVLELASVMDNFKYVMYFVNIFIALVVAFLINYTIKFMFQKRSKEFGTYMILGIPKKKITKMFMLENIILGVISFLISLVLGLVLSLFMSFIIMNIFMLPFEVKMDISLEAILLSVVYFIFIYLVVLILARKRIKKMKIYDLLYLDKQNEKFKKKKKIYRNIGFIISLLLGVLALVIFDKQFVLGEEPSMGVIFLCLILVIISIYGLSFTLADFCLNFMLKRKKIKYNKDNLFVIRTFSSKVKTMSFTLGTLTLLITLTLVALNMSSMLKGMFEYQIDTNAPYDISIFDSKDKFPQYLEAISEEYTILEEFTYDSYEDPTNNVKEVVDSDYDGWKDYDQVIKLSDYNELLKLKNMEEVSLKDDEYLLHVTKEYDGHKDNDDLKEITLANGVSLKLKEFTSLGYSRWVLGSGYIIVVPDDAVKGLELAENHLVVDTKEKTTEDFAKKLVDLAEPDMCEENDLGYTVCYQLANISVRGQEEANNNGFMTISSFVFYYVAIIFTTIVGTILAIQALSDSTKYKYRYTVLRKLGVSDDDLSKTIRKQLGIFFIFPVIYPIIISFFSIFSLNKIFQIALYSDLTYLSYFLGSLGIFFVIYIIYFIATYFGFKKNIKE